MQGAKGHPGSKEKEQGEGKRTIRVSREAVKGMRAALKVQEAVYPKTGKFPMACSLQAPLKLLNCSWYLPPLISREWNSLPLPSPCPPTAAAATAQSHPPPSPRPHPKCHPAPGWYQHWRCQRRGIAATVHVLSGAYRCIGVKNGLILISLPSSTRPKTARRSDCGFRSCALPPPPLAAPCYACSRLVRCAMASRNLATVVKRMEAGGEVPGFSASIIPIPNSTRMILRST